MSELVLVLNNAGWPVLLLGSDGKLRHGNPSAVAAFGEAMNAGAMTLAEIWSPENPFTPENFLKDWQRTSHGTHPLNFRGAGDKTISAVASLCEFQHAGEELFLLQLLPPPIPAPGDIGQNTAVIHKQKLDCALQLARTMALDFNNALTSILGHTSLIIGRMEATPPWRASLVEVEKSAARAAEIASDLATFSRQDHKEPRGQSAGNLNTLLQRVAELFQNSAPDKASWNLQLARKLYEAKFDEAKLQQVFAKILENSLQAIGKDGRITVSSRNIDLTAPTQDRNAQLTAGSYVCAEITDNGSGIAADVLPKIFEPFFTTKKGNHRGLGLAWVYGVVTNHGGAVAVSSTPGQGASVRVYLPAEQKLIQDTALDSSDLKGEQTILIVDDEDLLLTMGQAILSSFGYKVLTANGGQKALEILSKGEPEIDLIITDLVMPGMSGRELVEQARQLHPDSRVLCTSGYVFTGNEENHPDYLQKPFTSRELLLKVKAALAPVEE